ncbi:MAG TPA: adenylate/guanylate cyclase domain-containing protein, partial [Thermohalobaculum sp.]|nr:adenylate/guanylate cyclase domain-containing protein [Thermohalobaculum sp.]
IGGGVNTASRLESRAEPGEIMMSYETYAHVKDQILCEEYGEIEVKGIAYPVAVYKAIGRHEKASGRRRHLREDHPSVKLDLDLDTMTEDDRARAAAILRQGLELLSPEDQTTDPAPSRTDRLVQ